MHNTSIALYEPRMLKNNSLEDVWNCQCWLVPEQQLGYLLNVDTSKFNKYRCIYLLNLLVSMRMYKHVHW